MGNGHKNLPDTMLSFRLSIQNKAENKSGEISLVIALLSGDPMPAGRQVSTSLRCAQDDSPFKELPLLSLFPK